jgi:hypothetical protein
VWNRPSRMSAVRRQRLARLRPVWRAWASGLATRLTFLRVQPLPDPAKSWAFPFVPFPFEPSPPARTPLRKRPALSEKSSFCFSLLLSTYKVQFEFLSTAPPDPRNPFCFHLFRGGYSGRSPDNLNVVSHFALFRAISPRCNPSPSLPVSWGPAKFFRSYESRCRRETKSLIPPGASWHPECILC